MEHTLRSLIKHLEDTGVLKSSQVKKAFLAVDRINYVPERLRDLVYHDSPLVLAEGQTISQPTTVAFMLEMMDIQKGNKILDIGGGSGWVTALMAYLVGEEGFVYAYEINELMGMIGAENLQRNMVKNASYEIVNAADVWEKYAPYDRIYSGAAFQSIPMKLKEQLAIDGVLVAPTQDGYVRRVTRASDTEFHEEEFYGYTFVPFMDR